jgi:hypothetical protein
MPDLDKMVVEFKKTGDLITTATFEDGRVEVTKEKYSIDDAAKILTIHAQGDEPAITSMYRFEHNRQLRVHSERFIVIMEPYGETE